MQVGILKIFVVIRYGANLHSSMDRLKEISTDNLLLILYYLHSSMDRLKARTSMKGCISSSLFTFQYG